MTLSLLGVLACSDDSEAPAPTKAAQLTLEVSGAARPEAAEAAEAAPAAPPAELRPAPAPEPAAPAEDAPRFGAAQVGSTLEGAMVDIAGPEEGPRLAQVAKRVLVWWVDLRRDLRKGDRVELVWAPKPDAEPELYAIWFESQKLGGTRQAIRFTASGAKFPRWVEPDGAEVAARLTRPPIEDYEQITSLLRDGRGHRGVDFKAPVGTPVLAPFDGTVSRRNWSTRRNGYCVELRGKGGLVAFFLHLDSIPDRIRPGRRVKAGDIIARSGNTGRSTAPHLHYQLERGGKVLDPFRVHDTRRQRLSPEDLQAARAVWARYEKMRAGSK